MADKIAGTTTAAMGFVRDGLFYYPNSALKADVKTLTAKPFLKVSAILVKGIIDEKYSNMTYIAKDISISDIAKIPGVSCKIDLLPESPQVEQTD